MGVFRGIYRAIRFVVRRFWWLVFLVAMLALNWATLTRPGANLGASRLMTMFGADASLYVRGIGTARLAAEQAVQNLTAARAEAEGLRAGLASARAEQDAAAALRAATAERIEARQTTAVLRQRASLPAQAVPGAGFTVSWLLAAKALEDACETLGDLGVLRGEGGEAADCAADLPPEDALRQQASRDARAAWTEAGAVLPDLPDLPEPVQSRVPDGVRLIPAPGTPPRAAE